MEFDVRFDEREFTEEEDEQWEAFLSFMREHRPKEKALIINPHKIQLLEEILQKLKYLLSENGFDYKLKINRCEYFDTVLYITIILDSFGVAPKDYHIFKDVIDMVDSISLSALQNGSLDITMAIDDVFIRLK